MQFDWLSGHARPRPPKDLAPTSRKFRCLSAYKLSFIPHFFHKNLAIWLTESIDLNTQSWNGETFNSFDEDLFAFKKSKQSVWCFMKYYPSKNSVIWLTVWVCLITSLHKKWSFPLRISSVNVTKSAFSCGFGLIYWRNP